MRRILLGGLGLALGVLGRPALAQDWPPRPANTAPQSSDRGARLGRPVAVPDTAPGDPGVTPAGLLSRGQPVPTSQPVFGPMYPVNQSYPVGTQSYPVGQPFIMSQMNPTGQPMPGTPMPGSPMPGGLPPVGMPPITGDQAPKPRDAG